MLEWKTKTKQQTNLTIQLEKINQKILAKEGKLKRYRDKVKQYKQNKTFQNNEIKFYQMYEDKPITGCKGSKTIL